MGIERKRQHGWKPTNSGLRLMYWQALAVETVNQLLEGIEYERLGGILSYPGGRGESIGS